MASARTPESLGETVVSLFKTLRLTKGPGPHETACPICYNTFEPGSLTIEHPGCGRRFDDRCLRIWLVHSTSNYPTCPICREDLVPPEYWDLPPRQRAQALLTARRKLPRPSRFAVNWNSPIVKEAIKLKDPGMSDNEIGKALLAELTMSLDAVRTMGFHEEMRIFPIRSLVERLDTFNFPREDVRELWKCARLFGFSDVMPHRVSAIPDIGVWLPLLPWVEVVQHPAQLQRFFTDDVLHAHMRKGSSDLLQIPIPTDYLRYYLWVARDGPHPSRVMNLKLGETAQKLGATHWGVLDFRKLDHGPEIILMPWPNDLIVDGYAGSGFPGWGPKDPSAQSLGGWEARLDSAELQSFVDRKRRDYEQSKKAAESAVSFNMATLAANLP